MTRVLPLSSHEASLERFARKELLKVTKIHDTFKFVLTMQCSDMLHLSYVKYVARGPESGLLETCLGPPQVLPFIVFTT